MKHLRWSGVHGSHLDESGELCDVPVERRLYGNVAPREAAHRGDESGSTRMGRASGRQRPDVMSKKPLEDELILQTRKQNLVLGPPHANDQTPVWLGVKYEKPEGPGPLLSRVVRRGSLGRAAVMRGGRVEGCPIASPRRLYPSRRSSRSRT